MNKSENLGPFPDFLAAIKCICKLFCDFLQSEMSDFITLLYPELVKSLPFHIPGASKRYPFLTEPPRIIHYREYPPSGGGGGLEGL